jgi:hypothetical protein
VDAWRPKMRRGFQRNRPRHLSRRPQIHGRQVQHPRPPRRCCRRVQGSRHPQRVMDRARRLRRRRSAIARYSRRVRTGGQMATITLVLAGGGAGLGRWANALIAVGARLASSILGPVANDIRSRRAQNRRHRAIPADPIRQVQIERGVPRVFTIGAPGDVRTRSCGSTRPRPAAD